ncbi:MAG: hypothetical protein ACE5G1_06585, partial [bacterium]
GGESHWAAPTEPSTALNVWQAETSNSEDSNSAYYTIVEEDSEEEEEDQKTIIDIVRLSARSHKKSLLASGIGLVITCVLFAAVDTFAHITVVGTHIYDFLFPPAIKIDSGARPAHSGAHRGNSPGQPQTHAHFTPVRSHRQIH